MTVAPGSKCERLRRPDLDRQPLAITQRNRGGFVAVSYEAKACGVRKGDGIGRGGLLHLEAFRGRAGEVVRWHARWRR